MKMANEPIKQSMKNPTTQYFLQRFNEISVKAFELNAQEILKPLN